MKSELKDLFAAADVVISRAGANAICELLALKKPNILVPLPSKSSRGDQILNAKSFEAQGFSIVIDDDDVLPNLIIDRVHELYFNRSRYIERMSKSEQIDAIPRILELINESVKGR